MSEETLQVGAPKLQERARLVAIKDNELVRRLVEAAKADHHLCIAPTHVMLRGDQIIGYLSLGGMPVVQAWFDSQSGHVFDSLKMIEMGETVFDSQGCKQFMIAVDDKSPFFPHMERLGFKPVMQTTLFHKAL